MEERILDPELSQDDIEYDRSLRPAQFTEFVGQEAVKRQLEIFIAAAKKRGESLDHVLLTGPPGLGKTTVAGIIANEMGTTIRTTSGPAVERAGDLAAILTNLGEGEVLFIDEIHRLNKAVEEILYPAMEDFEIDIMVGKGPSARSIRLDLPRFTLVGATTRTGHIASPLRDRFGVASRLELYGEKDLERIVSRSAAILEVQIDEGGRREISRRSRGTPRVANRLLKRVRDYAEVKSDGRIDHKVAATALAFFDVDEKGLDKLDREILGALVQKFHGQPVGLSTLATAIGEEAQTLEDVYEPYLLQLGFVKRTARGRVPTPSAYTHLGVEQPSEGSLF